VFGGTAWAADLPLKAPAAPAYYDWTGFYLGGNLGAANGTTSFSDTIRPLPSTFSSSNPASFIGGGQLGINYEFRSGLVVGAEAMFDWLANAPTTFTALEPNGRHSDWNDQQSLDHHGDGQGRICVGPSACLRQGRRRVGRWDQQFVRCRRDARRRFRQLR
jgi:hypothetical protein